MHAVVDIPDPCQQQRLGLNTACLGDSWSRDIIFANAVSCWWARWEGDVHCLPDCQLFCGVERQKSSMKEICTIVSLNFVLVKIIFCMLHGSYS